MEKFVEQLTASLSKGHVATRTPLHQKFTEFLKGDEAAREYNNNLREPGQTMASKKAFRLRCADAEVSQNPLKNLRGGLAR